MEAADNTGLIDIAVATLIGLAIGLERGWKELDEDVKVAAGIRTFTLAALLGGITGWLQVARDLAAVVPAFVAVALLAATAYAISVWRNGDVGLTSEFALLITFLLGAAAGMGYWAISAGVAVGMALILGLKAEIHRVVQRLDRGELLATLQLLVLAILVLPLLPDREVFGVDGLNPRTIGLLVLLVSVVSYIGYFSVQILGTEAGLLLTSAFGGLASSTAVTVSYSRLAHVSPHASSALGGGIALACAVMPIRLLILVSFVAPGLISSLVWPMLPLALLPLAATSWQIRKARGHDHEPVLELRNPLSIGTALIFGAFLTVLFVLVPAIRELLGTRGVFALAGLSGLTNVDAISLSAAQSANDALITQGTATVAIVIAVISNTIVKAAITMIASGGSLRLTSTALLAGALVAGAIAAL